MQRRKEENWTRDHSSRIVFNKYPLIGSRSLYGDTSVVTVTLFSCQERITDISAAQKIKAKFLKKKKIKRRK